MMPNRWLAGDRRPKVLVYHDVAKMGSSFTAELGITIDPENFEKQIAFLKNNFDIVSVSEILRNPSPGRIAITFDDGMRSIFTQVLPVIESYSVPIKIYIPFDTIGQNLSWLNKLSYLCVNLDDNDFSELARDALNPVGLTRAPSLKDFIQNFDARKTIPAIDCAFDRYYKGTEPRLYLSSTEIETLGRNPLVEMGSHSKRHMPLANLDLEQLREEVSASHENLRGFFGKKIAGFAIPFGYKEHCTNLVINEIKKIDDYVVTAYGGALDMQTMQGIQEINRIPVWGNCGVLSYMLRFCGL